MRKKMTIAEMESQFNSEWVLIEDPEVSEDMQIIGGTMIFHSPDRNSVRQKMAELRPSHAAVMFLGEPPTDMHYAFQARRSRVSNLVPNSLCR